MNENWDLPSSVKVIVIPLPHSTATHLTDDPSLPASLLRPSPHSPFKARRWVSQCTPTTPTHSALWDVMYCSVAFTVSVIGTYTNKKQPLLSTADIHWHSPTLADTQLRCLSQLCFVLSSLLLLFFLHVSVGPMQLLTISLSLNDRTHRHTMQQHKWNWLCSQTEAMTVKSEDWYFCLKQDVNNVVIAWRQLSTLAWWEKCSE